MRFVDEEGKQLGVRTLHSGLASIQIKFLGSGSHAIEAIYEGDRTFASSTSPVLVQQVR